MGDVCVKWREIGGKERGIKGKRGEQEETGNQGDIIGKLGFNHSGEAGAFGTRRKKIEQRSKYNSESI